MISFPLVALVVAIVFTVRYVLNFYALVRKMPPGPTPWPLLGNMLMFGGAEKTSTAMLHTLSEKYGPIMTFWMAFGQPSVLLSSWDAIDEGMLRKAQPFCDRPPALSADIVFRGKRVIFTGKNSEFWQLERRIVLHSMKRIVNRAQIEDNVNETIADLAERLGKMCETSVLLEPYLFNCVFNVMNGFAFGTTRLSFDDENFKKMLGIARSLRELNIGMELVDAFLPQSTLLHAAVKKYYPPLVKLEDRMGQLERYVAEQFHAHKRRGVYLEGEPADLTDALLAERENIIKVEGHSQVTDDDLIGLIFDLFIGMCPALTHQEQAAFPFKLLLDSSHRPQVADMGRLPYVESCILESMRRRPHVPLNFARTPPEDTTFGGYFIPKDTPVYVNTFALNSDPKIWKKPNEFDPQNFIDEKTGKVSKPRNFHPFGFGKRECVGKYLAQMKLFMIFAGLLQRFKFKSVPGEKYTDKASPMSEEFDVPYPFRVIIEPRV